MGAQQSAPRCCAARRRKDRTRAAQQDGRRRLLPKASVALIGNSIIYYNDTPRLLEAFGGSDLFDQGSVEQDSCLRGGVGFEQLLAEGNGMDAKFGEVDQGAPDVATLLSRHWDYVVMNDYTQAPARAASRRASVEVLTKQMVPLLRQCGGTPILLETWAYRAHTNGSDDLGEHAEFTSRLQAEHIRRWGCSPLIGRASSSTCLPHVYSTHRANATFQGVRVPCVCRRAIANTRLRWPRRSPERHSRESHP